MKFYTYYVALGYLKKRGFTRFETFDGQIKSIWAAHAVALSYRRRRRLYLFLMVTVLSETAQG